MRRDQLAHVLRAAADTLAATEGPGRKDFYVIGSAAILASVEDLDLPIEATRSDEGDLVPFDDPDGHKTDLIDGAIGELSPFASAFGFYGHGVDLATAWLPAGWGDRLVVFDAPSTLTPARGHCLEPHDLAASKVAVLRRKDADFVRALLDRGLIDPDVLLARLELLPRDRVPARKLVDARRFVEGWIAQRQRRPRVSGNR